MKKLGKGIVIIAFVLAAAYVGYNLFTGQMELTPKGYLLVFVMLPLVLLVSLWDRRKGKKHLREVDDAGGNLQGDVAGEVRTPLMQRVSILFLLLVFWVMVLLVSFLMYQDIGIPREASTLVPFATLWGILILATILIILFSDVLFREIQYDSSGVTYRKKFHKVFLSWQDFGEEKSFKNAIAFYGRNGEKLFSISAAYEGTKEFLLFYQKKKASSWQR